MTKIFITGIAGFIGYHLAKNLAEQGYEVSGIDNFNDYYDYTLKRTRVEKLRKENDVQGVYCDLKNDWDPLKEMDGSDLVVHLAAYAGVRHSLDNPDPYVKNNIVGSHNLIQFMKKKSIKKVVFASTSCVMAGNPLPWSESEKLGVQKNPYGYTKAANEAQFLSAPDLDVAIGLRFFTVYGPWGRPDMALFDFTKKIAAGEPIQLFNYGNMKRDFTYIDDIIQGLNIVIKKALAEDEDKDIYNIGYGQQVQLGDFVDEIEKNLGRKAIRELVPPHPADTLETWSDTTKLQALGYRPTTPIPIGVERFVSWYKDFYKVN
jgi:UDP-glucuronate 4-epimerase